jgi:hypothetical protein
LRERERERERERSLILFLGGGGVGAPPKSHNLRRGWLAIIMAGGRTQKNKAHKTRFASKSSRNAHKVSGEKSSGKGAGKGPARRAIPTGQTVRDLRLQRNKNVRDLDPPFGIWVSVRQGSGFKV